MPTAITSRQLIKKIEKLISEFKSCLEGKNYRTKPQLQKDLAGIRYYFDHPSLVHGATYDGGMTQIKEKYAPSLLRVGMYIANNAKLSNADAVTVHHGFSSIAQRYKVKRAYTDLYLGKKFQKAGLGDFDAKHLLSQVNPVVLRSRQNMAALRSELKELKGNNNNHNGLRDDEVGLFQHLLDLPYRLQHATNYYYPLLNAGSLDSYTEIQRREPDYQSPFSTKGNVDKLGNGGFAFFRLYVAPVNGNQTRYGDTSLIFDLNLLRRCGWISLHDQLNPFPGNSPNSRHFYWEKRLLRMSAAVAVSNNTKDKMLHDGLVYRYRDSAITGYAGTKDTQASFGKTITVVEKQRSFLGEMFYAEDILPGIALSVIRELRYLEQCGFRAFFLQTFSTAAPQQQIVLLGELLKGLFRIEGKYPAAIRLQANPNSQMVFFRPMLQPDAMHNNDRRLVVTNPDGDGRFNIDITTNQAALAVATANAQIRSLDEKLSIARRQRAKFRDDEKRVEELNVRITDLEAKLAVANRQVNQDQTTRQSLIDYFFENFEVDREDFAKVSTVKMQLIKEHYTELLENGAIEFDDLLATMTKQLRLIAADPFIDLLVDEQVTFAELTDYSLQDLEVLSQYDIAKPITEKNMTIEELIRLYHENPRHLECLTCDDLSDLVLDIAPNVDPLVMQYAKEEDVDFEWVEESLCESDRMVFRRNLGCDDDPEEDNTNDFNDFNSDDEADLQTPDSDDEVLQVDGSLSRLRL